MYELLTGMPPYGDHGGAFQTVAAILTYPDFYKVAVAASGNHDNNIYIQWWGEAFHGLTEKTDPKTGKTVFSTKIPTNMELAKNLKGHLMLITGDVDKNSYAHVNQPYNTLATQTLKNFFPPGMQYRPKSAFIYIKRAI